MDLDLKMRYLYYQAFQILLILRLQDNQLNWNLINLTGPPQHFFLDIQQ